MKIHPRSLANLKPMKPGETLNPGGKPVNSRNRLQGKFLRAIADDFELHGLEALQRMREEKPERYIECIAALMPKEFAQTSPLDGYTEEEIDDAIAAVEATIVAKAQQQPQELQLVTTQKQ